jgi:type I restriction enzyme, S subunit
MLQSEPLSEDDELLPYLRAINISRKGVDLSHEFVMWIKPHEREKFRLRPDDVLVSEGGDAGRAAHFQTEGEFYFQNAINRVRPIGRKTLDARYLYYWFTFLKLAGYVDLSCNVATIAHFTAEKVKAAPLAFPALDTQRRIAAFLDEKTAQIDGLIARKQTLLARLAEKRQAIITQAVTKGLNPAAPMKDSGIDWLGQIPAHWEVVALNKVTTKITNGYVGPTRDLFVNDGVRYLQSLHIKGNRILFGNDFFVEQEWSERHAKSILKTGDVLVVQTGDIGQVACVSAEYEGCNCHALIICTPVANRLDGRYLAWLFNSDYGQEFLHMVKTGALHPHLNCGHVKFFNVLIPPVAEQMEIAGYVDDQRNKLEAMTSKVQLSIARLKEYRNALISSAVTGQMEQPQ